MREQEARSGRPADADGELSETTAHRLLGHDHRRALLDRLAGCDESLSLTDAATAIVAGEDRSDPDPGTVQEVYLSLYHAHVPKFAEHGVVTLDRETNRVALTDRGRRLVERRERTAETG